VGAVEELLAAEKVVWLATCRADGRPHLTPIWHRFLDGRFWMCTTEGSVKVRNLRANASCSVALGTTGQPVVAEGVARLHDRRDSPFPAAVVAAFVDAFGWDIDADDEGYTQLIEVEVSRWLYRPSTSAPPR
jgi:PPOX class probable F420-dependent enzyme